MSRPALSVVVAASDSAAAVGRTLASLGRPGHVELIVASARDRVPAAAAPVGVRWVAAEAGAGVPRLRAVGAALAAAEVVAFTEDSCVLDPGWCDAWVDAFRAPSLDAATGPVEHREGGSPVDWAVFFSEYAPFLAPPLPGAPTRLAGNNFAVRRELVMGRSEAHETILAHSIRRRGGVLAHVPAARAWHVRRFGLREALRDRFRFGRGFGRLRGGSSRQGRLVAVPAGPAIFASQVGRLVATLLVKRRHGGRFVATLPMTLALLAAWSAGEWLGWLEGDRPAGGCRRRGTAGRPAGPATGPAPSRRPGCRSGPAGA